MQRFFVGMHRFNMAHRFDAVFISALRLWDTHMPVLADAWVMDSGGFVEVTKHGGYRHDEAAYAEVIRRYAREKGLLAAVAQDYMCEPIALRATGLTVADHQRLTIERYRRLIACDVGGVTIIPVLQGVTPQDYVDHLRAYGDLITPGMWVGIGSVCKRQGKPRYILAVILAILRERPDLRLHGFGVKLTSLRDPWIHTLLYSADSMAWSFGARMARGDSNSLWVARHFEQEVLEACGLPPGFHLANKMKRHDLAAEAATDNRAAGKRRAANEIWNQRWAERAVI